ncbi:hypothetical protein PIB30_022719 [Stylosanthes scabra]|uniref:Uncharacterized protein n=1 Tax=Stylosanthes scabra TaxID=79078 RepID=A0ABU6Y9A7_9FABA|nr:hypothetical protein [Stylosanthes scabra]
MVMGQRGLGGHSFDHPVRGDPGVEVEGVEAEVRRVMSMRWLRMGMYPSAMISLVEEGGEGTSSHAAVGTPEFHVDLNEPASNYHDVYFSLGGTPASAYPHAGPSVPASLSSCVGATTSISKEEKCSGY